MHFNTYLTAALTGASLLTTTVLATSKPKNSYARNLKTISLIYKFTVFPRNFTGFEESIEYFFALALTPNPPSYSVFTDAEVVSFSSGCPEVAASVAYLETRVLNYNSTENGKYLSTLKQVAFWRFDKHGAVIAFDAWIPNLNIWNFLTRGEADITNHFVQQAFIERICPAIQGLCTGAIQQYTDVPACIASMNSKPFGNYDEV
ncbi:uncharacterized protein RAG0_13595 [Rhynchosporium agropyri]|uniref:Uncharacterized protein n=1 Tax=Rhynchosporium agropyri TaxID=914238 RepID=A0A1E1LDH4_9HELO|nr:uncharacterized protein RAG0_13595 [Rhynchosporium agropyri]